MCKLSIKICRFSLLVFLLLFLCSYPVLSDTGSGGRNAPDQLDQPYLVLISIDGFRWDYPDLYPTPAIERIARRGVKAEAMQPVFPTLTFPNHYSIATGMLPAHHGLVANEFPDEETGNWYNYKSRSTVQDGSWYLAEPIWVTAEKQGMVTAAYFFVGTEADVQGVRPTHWRKFDADDSGEKRVRQVLEWLAEPAGVRPHLVTLYFEEVDDYAHWYGPGSPESIESIRRVDEQIGQLLDGIATLPCAVNGSPRFPDIIVQADPGCAVISSEALRTKITPGDHGWPPEMEEMRGVFMASGPGIAPGTKTGVVHVTDVYPLMMKILGLTYPGSIDGDLDRLPSLLEIQSD